MAIQQQINAVDKPTTTLPAPPDPNDQDTYDSRGSAYAPKWKELGLEMKNFTLPTLQQFVDDVNNYADEMNDTADSVNTKASEATTAAANASSYETQAEKWANYTSGYVSGTQYSAKYWAQKAHEYATSGNYGDVYTDEVNEYDYAQRGKLKTLTYGSTVTIDMRDGNDFEVTLTGNATIANPTNLPSSGHTQGGTIYITQDSTGGRTVSWGDSWQFLNDDGLNTVAGKTSVYTYRTHGTTVEIFFVGSY